MPVQNSDLKSHTLSPVPGIFSPDKLRQGAKDVVDVDDFSDDLFIGPVPKFTIKRKEKTHQQVPRVPRLLSRYIQPNALFIGEQESSSAKYHISVTIKTVNLLDSMVSGYLTISGLTITHPKMTTSFRGEIINNPLHNTATRLNKTHSFITHNPAWGSSVKNDLVHWSKLAGCTEMNETQFYSKLSRIQSGCEDHGLIYMRWKEEFLVPDSRVKRINGASFEGFYYVVLNIGGYNKERVGIPPGGISGLYYHKSSERFQSLTLRYTGGGRESRVFEFQ